MFKNLLPLAGCLLFAMATQSGAQVLKSDGSIEIAGRNMRCAGVPIILDASLPTEGMFAPGDGIVLNPEMMQSHPAIVRVFMFAHECGHNTVGGDELGADCAAARQGAREGWLTPSGIAAVCRDLDERMADADHPAGSTRCANIRRCFAGAASAKPVIASATLPAKERAFTSGIAKPKTLAEKLRRAASAWRSAFGSSDVAAAN